MVFLAKNIPKNTCVFCYAFIFLLRKNEETFTFNVDVSRPEKHYALEYLEIICLYLFFLVANTVAMSEIKFGFNNVHVPAQKKNFSVKKLIILLKNPWEWETSFFGAVYVYNNTKKDFSINIFKIVPPKFILVMK